MQIHKSQDSVNSPSFYQRKLNHLCIPQIIKLVLCLGGIMLITPGKQEEVDMSETLVKHMYSRGCRGTL